MRDDRGRRSSGEMGILMVKRVKYWSRLKVGLFLMPDQSVRQTGQTDLQPYGKGRLEVVQSRHNPALFHLLATKSSLAFALPSDFSFSQNKP